MGTMGCRVWRAPACLPTWGMDGVTDGNDRAFAALFSLSPGDGVPRMHLGAAPVG